MTGMGWVLWMAVAAAGSRKAVDTAENPLEDVLAKAGWQATPEGSDRYKPGNVYDARHGLWADDCFAAPPKESVYNELEVSLALKAGAKVPLGVASAEAAGVRYKKKTFADPLVSELAGRSLQPTDSCRTDLARAAASGGVEGWYVVQAVLLARVNEQECTELTGKAGAVGFGASASASEQCSVSSEGQVAVAYKTRPVAEVFGTAGAAAGSAATTVSSKGTTPTTPAKAGGTGGTGGGAVDDDVAALLRVKEMQAAREKTLTDLVAAKQAEGEAAWKKLAAVLTDGSAAEKAAVEKYIAAWSAVKVWVDDAEGRHERAVTIAAVETAKGWLAKAGKGGAGQDWESPTLGTMKWIPAGTFVMGSAASDAGHLSTETQHQVTLTKGYWMMEHEVTQGEWEAVMGENPSTRQKGRCYRWGNKAMVAPSVPVYCISKDEAKEFASRVGARDGVAYRLPTEAEWEYAARGGQSYAYAGSDDPTVVGWISANSAQMTQPVCQKQRNAFGLCDLTGNVFEYTSDSLGDYPRGSVTDPEGPKSTAGGASIRGGSWYLSKSYARVANRYYPGPFPPYDDLGLRLVRTGPDPVP